jgi:hypothetical protein
MHHDLEKLFDIITDLVNDEEIPWTEKKNKILAYLKTDEAADVAFEEFISWFEGVQ